MPWTSRPTTLFPLATRAVSPGYVDVGNSAYGAGRVDVNVASIDGGVTVTFYVYGLDEAGNEVEILDTGALAAAGAASLSWGPTLPNSPNQSVPIVPPRRLRFRAVHGGSAGNAVYSVSLNQYPV